jgi:hypothetical protein
VNQYCFRPVKRRLEWAVALALAIFLHGVPALADAPSEQIEFFEKNIRPVLVKHCYKCHSAGAKKVRSGFLLDTREGIRKGGGRGPAVVPSDPTASLLLKALRYEELQMPPSGKLPDRVIADFALWIKQGAVDPRDGTASQERRLEIEAAKAALGLPTAPSSPGSTSPQLGMAEAAD